MIGVSVLWAVSLVTALLLYSNRVNADADAGPVFELRVYHAVPGKLWLMESRFRDRTSKILARHNLQVIGYWISDQQSDNSFVFLLRHESREEAKKNWDAMRADPEFQQIGKEEQAERTLEKADITFMRATDFSPIK